MEGMCCTHRDDPVANMQCAVSVCCSPVCNARDVDSLKQIRYCQKLKFLVHLWINHSS